MDEMKEIEENTEKVNLESMGDRKEEEEESEERMEDITIPELPEGKILELRLLSNWGDPNFIGLNSLEIFTSTGERADVEKISTNATEYNGNLESLLTEQIRCKDTEKMWCARKSDQDQDIILKLELKEMTKLALVRFWNYNASRVHAQIGVRYLEMSFEGKGIFRGELECAFSADSEFTPIMGETVLFTTSESILEMISLHDVCLINLPEETVPNTSLELLKADHLTPYRPSTCEEKDTPNTPVVNPTAPKFPAPPPTSYRQDVKVLQIELVSNWGMNGLIGLTGLELVDDHNQLIDESQFSVVTSEGTKEQATKLFNGRNLTRDPEDMWLVDFDSKTPVVITISFHEPISLKAISLWNYNSSFELSYAGAKASKIYVNGKVIRNVLFRKAIGFVYFDYVQDIVLDPNFTEQDFLSKGPSQSIGGFVFQIRLLSTWGDEFYIGLNGIELFNRKGELMKIRENNLAAFPESVNILPNIKNDLRTSNNLIASPNDTDLAKHMWLTALLPNRCARVFFVFDVQTYISKIVIYNYRKTPERGVRHISLTVDDLIIFSGEIPPSTETMTGKLEINLLDL
ncbi:hypothetical protein L5515_001836 [Caenorhabditis briggsae]|uniref:KATNIP domain-containing protein n=1 Tax=Caenorhabditis briggsae TaxID=6238 RepID=A0AAE9J422_CAEBR|nr:hypothetical protein L5515_001836 [Caenorhabditis briggsae]